jgi:hypothetical protein
MTQVNVGDSLKFLPRLCFFMPNPRSNNKNPYDISGLSDPELSFERLR